jgi:hypothetical protein
VTAQAARALVTAVAVATALGLGLGCSSTGPKAATDKFLGDWNFSSGALVASCAILPTPYMSTLDGQTLTLTKGTTSDLVSTLQTTMGTCTLKLTVSGDVASADPGQTCTFNVTVLQNPVAVTVGITSWSVTLDAADPTKMTTAASAVGMGGLADGCPVTISGAASKGARDASAG